MLDEIIASLIINRKKYMYGLIAFILALLLVTIGVISTIFVAVVTIIGYNLGDSIFLKKAKKIKNILSEKLNED